MRTPPSRSWGALVVGLAAAASAVPALANGFAYDDVAIIAVDDRIHSFDAGAILTSGYWAGSEQALYRPLTTLSYAFDWSIAPELPAWMHLTNLLLHAGVSVLVFLLLVRFFDVRAAVIGALVFAVHPVHVEAVANVVGRAELLAALFVLAAMLLWRAGEQERPLRVPRALGVGVLALLATASKESAVVLPGLLLLVDFADGEMRAGLRPWLRRTAPGWAAVLVGFAVYMAVRTAVLGAVAPAAVDAVFEVARHGWPRLLTALQAWPHWLRLLFFPRTLLADYGPRVTLPADGATPTVVFGAVLLIATVGGGSLAALLRHRRTALALLWFPFAILPVSNLLVPIGVLVAERTLYLPSVALSVAGAGFAAALPAARPALRAAGTAAIVAALVLMAGRSAHRATEWRTTDRILEALVRDRPDAFRGAWHQARLAMIRGDTAAALADYDRALSLWPWRSRLVIEAAHFSAVAGRTARAHQLAEHAVRQWPDRLDAQRLLATTALDLGDTTTARSALRAGLSIDPGDDLLRRMSAALAVPPESAR